uniref:Uncharacterized protein n=1 Tax=Arion vulgaris TaxID=1028688 RepID=A0A0B7AUJ9_9EUPU
MRACKILIEDLCLLRGEGRKIKTDLCQQHELSENSKWIGEKATIESIYFGFLATAC